MKTIFKFLKKLLLVFFLLSFGMVLLYKFVPVPATPLMIARLFQQKANGEDLKWKHQWISIKEMPMSIQKAVIASEDGKFTTHNGFDFQSIQKAYESNQKNKKIRGGSTISQQTAKNVFLWQGKSYFRKGLEAYFTLLIEWIWGKERIMEVYLNSIEMGDGIYGIEAASKHWFGKSAKNISKREAAAIAAILPNPRKFRAKGGGTYVQKRISFIARQMDLYANPKY